jgi:hypothetical protein
MVATIRLAPINPHGDAKQHRKHSYRRKIKTNIVLC